MTILIIFISFIVPTFFETSNEQNTIEIEATIKKIENTDKDEYLIYIEEYECRLGVKAQQIISIDNFNKLKSNNKIKFRIVKPLEDNFINSTLEQIFIETLKTDDMELITFESTNKITEQRIRNARITGMVFAFVFILVITYCILKLNRVILFKRKPEDSQGGQGKLK